MLQFTPLTSLSTWNLALKWHQRPNKTKQQKWELNIFLKVYVGFSIRWKVVGRIIYCLVCDIGSWIGRRTFGDRVWLHMTYTWLKTQRIPSEKCLVLTFVVLFYWVVGVISKQGFKYWDWLMVWIVTFSNLSATRKSWLPDIMGR
jgi:hypothetical protein